MQKVRWGILGTGFMAHQFARALQQTNNVEIVAVGSRNENTATAFANEFNIPNIHFSYETLVNDKNVDIVYIALLNNHHADYTLLSLNSGKHVLCEKPFAISAEEAKAMVKMSREKKLFLMEAMWTRFLPSILKVKELLNNKVIGNVKKIVADFGILASDNPKDRVNNPWAGGGALFDLGVYNLSLVNYLFGNPIEKNSSVVIGTTGVDISNKITFKYENGAIAELSSCINKETPQQVFIYGENGDIVVHSPWWCSEKVSVYNDGKETQTFNLPNNKYVHEADYVNKCILNGITESHVMPLDESLAIMQTIDELRKNWGLKQ
jgi:predicted dehydrogenase